MGVEVKTGGRVGGGQSRTEGRQGEAEPGRGEAKAKAEAIGRSKSEAADGGGKSGNFETALSVSQRQGEARTNDGHTSKGRQAGR